ncbi:MAG: hypothetical protein BWY83_01750 [bacterium ADurb.Bin478]|nr:MAG: hypothetical protein BWY83_01750 [bacterium ADurb.Bin478]
MNSHRDAGTAVQRHIRQCRDQPERSSRFNPAQLRIFAKRRGDGLPGERSPFALVISAEVILEHRLRPRVIDLNGKRHQLITADLSARDRRRRPQQAVVVGADQTHAQTKTGRSLFQSRFSPQRQPIRGPENIFQAARPQGRSRDGRAESAVIHPVHPQGGAKTAAGRAVLQAGGFDAVFIMDDRLNAHRSVLQHRSLCRCVLDPRRSAVQTQRQSFRRGKIAGAVAQHHLHLIAAVQCVDHLELCRQGAVCGHGFYLHRFGQLRL